jgi:predicted permease
MLLAPCSIEEVEDLAVLFQDLHYALRQLRNAPGFAVTVVLTLALSVGVATAVFCVIDTVILLPLPYGHSDLIVSIESRGQSGYAQPASLPSLKDERDQVHDLAALAGYTDYMKMPMETPSNGAELIECVRSTDNFFEVFNVPPMIGRTYLPGEGQEGKNEIAVLGYDLWQKYFNGNRNVLNSTVKLDGRAYTIIGVMPAGFRFPLNMRNAIYIPLRLDHPWMNGRGNHWLLSVARLRDGATIEQAQADLSQVFRSLDHAFPQTDQGRTVRLQLLSESVTSTSKGPLWTLLAAVVAVLAIGCVNVAGLLMARGLKREREMAMRVAIGAGRTRLLRQLLTEAVMLAALGAAGGILLAWTILSLMRPFLIHALERGADIHLNLIVLAAAVLVSVAASIAASFFPALRLSGMDPNRALKSGGSAGTQRGQHRLRSGLVITQVALTLVLLAVAGLLIRMLTRYRHADLGFDPTHIVATDLNLTPARYQGRDIIADFYRPFLSRVAQIPGVRAVGVINLLPIQSWGENSDIHIAGQPPNPPHQEMLAENRIVSTGYFNVFGIPLRSGRALSPSLDRPENAAPTVVVNQAFVRKFIAPSLDPTTERMDDAPVRMDDADKEANWTRIVGVVGNVRQDIYSSPLAERDWLLDELPRKDLADKGGSMWLVVRFDGDPGPIIPALRNALHETDPTVPFQPVETMSDVISETLVFERMESWLFGIFAGLALALSLVGLYGLMSHEVEQSTRDIGVRIALGATRGRILGMTMGRVAWMLAAGVAVGLVLTLIARKTIGMIIYFEAQQEVGIFLMLALLLLISGLAAALLPAIRAASIEPMQALRNE